jgi:hypothetical protein
VYFQQRRYEEAEPMLKNAHALFKKSYGSKSEYIQAVHLRFVETLKRLNKDNEAPKFERDNVVWIVR